MVKFGTIEWAKEVKKVLEADKDYTKLMKGCNFTRLTIVEDKPELKPVFERLKDGFAVEIRNAEPNEKVDFSCAASYESWRELVTGKVSAQTAMIQGKTKVEGDIELMTKYLRGFMKAQEAQKKVAYEW